MSSQSLPPFILTSEIGSFARKTIEERKPIILDRILEHYSYPAKIQSGLLEFKEQLKSGKLQMLSEETSDRTTWEKDLAPWLGKPWLAIPWFLAEAYFFRKVLEIVNYFQPGPWQNKDPFKRLKSQAIQAGFSRFSPIYAGMTNENDFQSFIKFLSKALWGNRGDLSNMISRNDITGDSSEMLILDHSQVAYSFLTQRPCKIAYIMDNVGEELFFDLALCDALLNNELAESITLYLKNQPFFVSDTMPDDLEETLNYLETSPSQKDQTLGVNIRSALKKRQIQVEIPPFFTTSRMYRQMPNVLKAQLNNHDLAILKGDVNYRRLIGDRHWDHTTHVTEAAGYFPTSFLSLRTLKAEIAIGLDPEIVRDLKTNAESDWLTNGKRGMITYHRKDS